MEREGQIPADCHCCRLCKLRILRLQQMVEELFSYMSHYLPDQAHKLASLPPNEVYPPPPPINFAEPQGHISMKLATGKNQDLKDPPSINAQRPLQQAHKGRKEYSEQQKNKIMKEMQKIIKSGKTAVQACNELGISYRSYVRWKTALEQEQAQNCTMYEQKGEIVINNYNQ